jgi:mono/diheme cytochrome c family protein
MMVPNAWRCPMKKQLSITVLFAMAGIIFWGTVSAQMPGMGGMGMMGHSVERHRYVMMNGIPSSYSDMTNPLEANDKNVKEGAQLYAANCEACHGAKGYGNGPAGKALNTPPSDLSSLVLMPMATDPYLFWTISEGGKEFRTSMPPYKDTLSANDRWKIILYLRNKLAAQ